MAPFIRVWTLPEPSKASKAWVKPGAGPSRRRDRAAHRWYIERKTSDVQPHRVGVDRLVRVLVPVARRHEVPVGAGHQDGAGAEHEGVDEARGDRHRPAVLGEVVPGDVVGVVGGRGVERAAAGTDEPLVEVVVVVAQGHLRTRDLDAGDAVERAGLVRRRDLGDGASLVRVDVRHPGGVGERGGVDGDGHDGLSARWDGTLPLASP